MKQGVLLILFFVINVGFSQNEANIWYFGNHAGLDFNSGSPVILIDGQMTTQEGCASIADSNGNLQFYTDGSTIWTKNHSVMSNGTGLNGHFSSTQSAIIVPKPNSKNIYYVFTVDYQGEPNGLQYSEVDMTLNGGLGAVTTKNVLLVTPVLEKLTAIQHSNDNDIWVLAHKNGSAEFYAYLVTGTGVDTSPIITNIGFTYSGSTFSENAGYMKVSPDGTRLAMAFFKYSNGIQLFDFDPATGVPSNHINLYEIPGVAQPYGIEFSPSGEILYASGSGGVAQFDLTLPTAFDIQSSVTFLANEIKDNSWRAMQLATDGKIYITREAINGAPEIHALSVINNPDELGATCDFQLDAISLGSGIAQAGLPPFIQSFFIVGFEFENVCFGDSTQFNANISQAYDSVLWDFGDGNTSTVENPSHVYGSPGNYTVTLTVTSGGQTSTDSKQVVIYEKPIAKKPQDMLVCDDNNDGYFSFNLKNQDIDILNGQDENMFGITYYASMDDYTNNLPIADPTSYTNLSAYVAQTIIAKVVNEDKKDCEDYTSFNIQVFESPKPNQSVSQLKFCDDLSVGTDKDGIIELDLTERESDILNGQRAADFDVRYYKDAARLNEILTPDQYINTNANETIYVAVENKLNDQCIGETSFNIEVASLPIVTPIVDLKQCDDDLDGFSYFNLNEVIPKITSNAAYETIVFFESQADAENNLNPIKDTIAYKNQIVSSDTIWARIENSNGCYRTSQVNLIVITTQLPNTFTKNFHECDDLDGDPNNGISIFNFSSVDMKIKSMFPANQQLDIAYYRNEADALAEENPIADISNYGNIGYPNFQEIYVRVDSKLNNDCLGLGAHINLYVEPLPVVNPVSIVRQCDDDNDGEFPFDVSQVESTILSGQSLNDVTVTYFDANNNPLPSPLPNPFITASQIVTARVTNNNVIDDSCYDETTLEFIVDKQPIANSVPNQISCDDGIDDTDGLHDFNTSLIESIILNGQIGMEVHYYDEQGLELPSPLPNPFTSHTQTISVKVLNPINTSCTANTSIKFIVNPLPEFSIYTPQIVCSSDPTFTVVLDPIEKNASEMYDYEWVYEDGAMLSNEPTLTVSTPGTYYVTLTKTDGTSCSRTREIFVNASELATVTMDDITVIDVSSNNTVTIDTNNLGQGDYEFSLDDEFSFYQDEPVFENVSPGIYTLYVRDKKGCGTSSLKISVIGFPKFFTPNGDGNNDTWQIDGVNGQFQTQSDIYIYDRYGKLLKQLKPNSNGWDGTFNGTMLPNDDYWFSVSLEDGRMFKGHFTLKR